MVDIDCFACYRSLIATNGIQIMIRNGHLEGYVYLTGQHLPNTTTLTTIGRGVWTHIALRVMSASTNDGDTAVVFNKI